MGSMTDILQKASDWLEEMRTRHASRLVVYRRGGSAVAVFASIGRTTFQIDAGLSVSTQYESRDFLILAAELVMAGKATLPQRGDHIQETHGDKSFEYEVLAPGKEPCFRYSDPFRKTLRIHTKQVF
jgi:hypothetical protein